MESALVWEYKTLIDELTQGMEKAMQLQLHLRSTSCSEAQDLLLRRILSTFDKALMTLRRSQSIGQAQVGTPISVAPESSISVDGSPKSDDNKKLVRDHSNINGDKSKKRYI